MSASILAAHRQNARRIILWQAATVSVFALMGFVLWDVKIGVSAVAGGAVGIASTAYMALALFRQDVGASARRIAVGFIVGWVIKVLLTIALLWMVFQSKAFAPLAVVAGFATTFVAFGVVAVLRRD